MNRKLRILLPILSLMALDQSVKILIAGRYMEESKDIIKGVVVFHPIINTYYSWVNSLFNMGISWTVHIVFNILVILLSLLLFSYVRRKNPTDRYVFWLFTFLFAGMFCSLTDKLFWGGSLDYIWLKGFFIFDLKDVYLTAFEILMIAAVLFNYKGLRNIKTSQALSDIFRFTKAGIHGKRGR